MNSLSSILVIVDPTASEHPAVAKAAVIASKFHARLELFACETTESRAIRQAAHLRHDGVSKDFAGHVRAVLDPIATRLRNSGLDVCVESATGGPLHVQLLDRTQRTCADLVIKDTHHHSVAKRTFITNTDWHLIRGCPVPLLLTKAKAWSSAPVIAAAVDPGHVNDKPAVLDDRILDWALAFGKTLAGTVHAVHAYLPAVILAEAAAGMPAMASTVTAQVMEEERVQELKRLQLLVASYAIDSQHTHVQLGVASDVLPRFAAVNNVDLLVMGAISRSGLKRVFVGSTAERVLENLPCDVLVVKPPDFASLLPF